MRGGHGREEGRTAPGDHREKPLLLRLLELRALLREVDHLMSGSSKGVQVPHLSLSLSLSLWWQNPFQCVRSQAFRHMDLTSKWEMRPDCVQGGASPPSISLSLSVVANAWRA